MIAPAKGLDQERKLSLCVNRKSKEEDTMAKQKTIPGIVIQHAVKMFQKNQLHTIIQDERERSSVQHRRSLWIRHLDCGSCNGCELELTALENPVYDAQRLGIEFKASPRHADVAAMTGPFTRN